ncbi:MAG: hypothetical protein AB8G96_13390 [Phycisphaerales bacterium]
MTRSLLIAGGFVLATTAAANAGTIIAFSSFEEPAVLGGQYVDTLDPLTDHALLDNAGEPTVNFGGGAELGFTSFYTNTRDGVGLSDGDFIGVSDFTGTVGAYTDGLNGFQLSDTDGMVTTSMSTVDLTGVAAQVSVDLFVQDTGYEDDDRIRMWLEVDGGLEIDLFSGSGDALEGMGSWMTLNADLSSFSTATLHFELDSNSGSEAIFVDNIVFSQIPAPGALALLGLAGLAGRRRRRG